MTQAALLGGLFTGVLSALPIVSLGNCCCLWIISGGVLAAYLDQQNDPRPTTPGRGAIVGLMSGVAGAVVWLFASAALDAALQPLQEWVRGELIRTAQDMPPDAREILDSLMREPSTVGYVVGFLLLLVAGAIFSTLGGAIGAAYFRNDVPPALGGPMTPPPL